MLSKLLPICMLLHYSIVEKGWLHLFRHAICGKGRGIDIIYRRFWDVLNPICIDTHRGIYIIYSKKWDVLTLYQDTYLHGYMV
jgi:hypothetical protein